MIHEAFFTILSVIWVSTWLSTMFSWREFQKWENKFASLIVNVHEE